MLVQILLLFFFYYIFGWPYVLHCILQLCHQPTPLSQDYTYKQFYDTKSIIIQLMTLRSLQQCCSVRDYSQKYKFLPVTDTGARGTDPPFFSNILVTNLFSIKFLYFFIISSLFPYFNLFLSISIQSYVNIKLHVSTLYRY